MLVILHPLWSRTYTGLWSIHVRSSNLIVPNQLPWHVLIVKRGVFICDLTRSDHLFFYSIFLSSATLTVDNSTSFSFLRWASKLCERVLVCQSVILAHLSYFRRGWCALALVANGALAFICLTRCAIYFLILLLIADCKLGSAPHDIRR